MNFCTVVSIEFLPSLLVARRSIASTQPNALMDVLCMDDETMRALDWLSLPGVRLTAIRDLERADPELAGTRPDRLLKEYCWTAKSAFIRYLFDLDPEIARLTYIDSDIEFYGDLDEALSGEVDAAVYVYPHRMVEDWKKGRDRHVGDFNGGTVTFRRSPEAFTALDWWRGRCIDWCFNRYEEPDRWGDQKYLQTMAELFPASVRGVDHPGVGVAPWNARYRRLERVSGRLMVDGAPVIFYHFASLRLYAGLTAVRRLGLLRRRFRYTAGAEPLVWRAWEEKRLTDAELELFWNPYVARLSEAMAVARQTEPSSVSMRDGRRQLLDEWTATARSVAGRGKRVVTNRR